MRVSEALKLAEQSTDSFEGKLEKLSIKELYELTDNLRFTDNHEIFQISHESLMKKLLRFSRVMENLERNVEGEEGIDEIIHHVRKKTGFKIDWETSPSAGLKEFIDEIISWVQ